MHPAEELKGTKSSKLAGKHILVGVSGSIAAVETVKLCRELIRHGAEVSTVMTPSATRILHPDALEFATGRAPVVQLTGKTEHVAWCGLVADPVDLFVICPATANTISKVARGIDDTPVTTCATTAIGSGIPFLIVPAMHRSMYSHAIVQKNIAICRTQGITFLDPVLSGSKAKLVGTEEIVAAILRLCGPQSLRGKRIAVIGGATAQPIDDIRILTNRSSGTTAVALAREAYERGAQVELWYGVGSAAVPAYLSCTRFETLDQLIALVKAKAKTFDGIILCAALPNYLPSPVKGKIPSGKDTITLTLTKAPTVLSVLRKAAPQARVIGYKAEEKRKDVEPQTKALLKSHGLAAAVGNTLATFGATDSEQFIVTKTTVLGWRKGTKDALAGNVLDVLFSKRSR